MSSTGPHRKRRARKSVSGRPASQYVLECRRLSGTMCQRHISCCQGIEKCPFIKQVEAGATIFHMGEPFSGVYQLVSGVVGLVVLDENGAQSLVHLVEPGELFGHRCLVAQEQHAATAVAITRCDVWHVPERTARRVYGGDPKFREALHLDLARSLRRSRSELQRMVVSNVGDRLLRFFFDLSRQIGEPDGTGGMRVAVPLPYQDIAILLGHPAESISRTLAKLAQRELLWFDRYTVHLPASTLQGLVQQELAAAE